MNVQNNKRPPAPKAPTWAQTDNYPHDILKAWIAIEALTPKTFTVGADLKEHFLLLEDYFNGKTSASHQNYVSPLILGSIDLGLAYGDLLDTLGYGCMKQHICDEQAMIAILNLDRDMNVNLEDPLTISSF
ncbi:MAG: hypothetical protein B7X06_03260, partial [Verrucomicrobia bacterium 21-51-4]